MNASTDLQEILITHQIHIQRYGSGLSNRIVKLLNSADKDLVETIAKRLATIDKRGHDLGPATTARLEKMLAELRVLNSDVYSKVGDDLTTELEDFGQYEFQFQARSIENVIPIVLKASIPPVSMLKAIVEQRPLQGVLLKDWVSGMETGRLDRLEASIRIGLVEGETIDQIVKRVRGTAKMGFTDGILNISRRSAQAMVRTAVTHVSVQAREEVYSSNSDLISGVRWVSTLDSRTSAVCRARDGQIYQVGVGPRPAAHVACRSTTVPVLRSWREIGIDANDASPGIRASMDGSVPANTTYADFLKRKGNAFQDEILGKTKAAAFRKGMPLGGFIDNSGKELNLSQLRRLNPEFF